ncbi:MAG TPA: PD-(D/E)XK nuclease-like domain-containing protein [Kofleriaceae bacterium]|nr:PD-(D/E)XK nuclease-like domain-containing protein [Kofleriaceae bacterium]
MSYEHYRTLVGLRWSQLKHARRSLYHFRYHEELVEDRDTPSLLIGRAVHAGVLEPDRFKTDFVGWEGERRGNAWTAFSSLNKGRTILNAKEWAAAAGTIEAIRSSPAAAEYLKRGRSEVTLTWGHPLNVMLGDEVVHVWCKSRNDLVNGHLIDLKTTFDPMPRKFAAQAANLGYVEQLAFYREGLRANRVAVAPEAVLIAAESSPPHDVVVFEVAEHLLDTAEMVVSGLIRQVTTCRESNVWPGIAGQPIPLMMPAWWLVAGDDEPLTLNGVPIDD